MGCAASSLDDDEALADEDKLHAVSPDGRARPNERRVGFSSGKALAGSPVTVEHPPARPKDPNELQRLEACVSDMMLFSSLSAEQKKEIFDSMFEIVCGEGDIVIRQGDIGDVLYVVEDGKYDAYLRAKGDTPVASYESGYFGELAMMYNCPRAATVACSKAGKLWGLGRTTYEKVTTETVAHKCAQHRRDTRPTQHTRPAFRRLAACHLVQARMRHGLRALLAVTGMMRNLSPYRRMDSKSQFLRSVELLSMLSEMEREALADLLDERSYESGEYLWKPGEPADCLILIKTGQVEVKEPKSNGEDSARADGKVLNVGDFFGTQVRPIVLGGPPPAPAPHATRHTRRRLHSATRPTRPTCPPTHPTHPTQPSPRRPSPIRRGWHRRLSPTCKTGRCRSGVWVGSRAGRCRCIGWSASRHASSATYLSSS